eukprot:scaffold91799_cov63-Phaeocystis_antarctica.AAC.1
MPEVREPKDRDCELKASAFVVDVKHARVGPGAGEAVWRGGGRRGPPRSPGRLRRLRSPASPLRTRAGSGTSFTITLYPSRGPLVPTPRPGDALLVKRGCQAGSTVDRRPSCHLNLFSTLRQLGAQVDGCGLAASAATPTRLAASAPCPRTAGGLAPLLVRWTYPLAHVGGLACFLAVSACELPAQVAAATRAATCLRTARGRRHGLNHVLWLSRRGGAAAEAGGACCDGGI